MAALKGDARQARNSTLPFARAAGSGRPGATSLRLIYLSNERNTDAAAYGRIVEFVKRGGRLIVGVGRESDIPF